MVMFSRNPGVIAIASPSNMGESPGVPPTALKHIYVCVCLAMKGMLEGGRLLILVFLKAQTIGYALVCVCACAFYYYYYYYYYYCEQLTWIDI
jgi:hypothetical protein